MLQMYSQTEIQVRRPSWELTPSISIPHNPIISKYTNLNSNPDMELHIMRNAETGNGFTQRNRLKSYRGALMDEYTDKYCISLA